MRTKPKERYEVMERLSRLGIDYETANQLRRISMTLHSWFEGECGTGTGCIERDETTGQTYWHNATTGKRWKIADRETGAKKRLQATMAKLPGLVPYIQGDCRGASLYILRDGVDVKPGEDIDSIYSRGTAVY